MAIMKGQAALEYLVLLAVFLLIAIVAIIFSGAVPDFAVGIENRNSQNYWGTQARPFTISEADYQEKNGRAYIALGNHEAEQYLLTGIYVNGSKLAFFEYNSSYPDGVGLSSCDSGSCSGTCACALAIGARRESSIVTESFMSADDICGRGGQVGRMPFRLTYSRPAPYNGSFTEKSPIEIAFACTRQN